MPDAWPILLAIPLFAWADRTVGGAGRRSVAFTAVQAIGLVAAAWSGAWDLAAVALIWVGYRSLPFSGAFGSITPQGPAVAATAFRHGLPAIAALLSGRWRLAAALLAYAVAATALGMTYAAIVARQKRLGQPGGDENSWIESLRGAAFGAALAAGGLV